MLGLGFDLENLPVPLAFLVLQLFLGVGKQLCSQDQHGQSHPEDQVEEQEQEGFHGQLVPGIVVEGEELVWDDLLQEEGFVRVKLAADAESDNSSIN